MIRTMREVRLLPVVIVAAAALFALKTSGLIFNGGYTIPRLRAAHAQEATVPPPVREAWPQDMSGYPDITGSVDTSKAPDKATPPPAEDPKVAKAEPPKAAPPAVDNAPADRRLLSPAERAILERLQERRQELDQRGRELELRESLLKAAEKRLEAKVAELKDIEARINTAMNRKDEAEAARFKSIVTMYENMKPKEAAKIFDRLDMKVLFEVASQMNPRRLSDILAQMSADAAERLTVELARRTNSPDRAPTTAELPKIEGRLPVP
jgi:flagellar motility protein MotE (MotC chaperone)